MAPAIDDQQFRINDLPPELFSAVVSFLPPRQIYQVQRVSKKFQAEVRGIVSSDSFIDSLYTTPPAGEGPRLLTLLPPGLPFEPGDYPDPTEYFYFRAEYVMTSLDGTGHTWRKLFATKDKLDKMNVICYREFDKWPQESGVRYDMVVDIHERLFRPGGITLGDMVDHIRLLAFKINWHLSKRDLVIVVGFGGDDYASPETYGPEVKVFPAMFSDVRLYMTNNTWSIQNYAL